MSVGVDRALAGPSTANQARMRSMDAVAGKPAPQGRPILEDFGPQHSAGGNNHG